MQNKAFFLLDRPELASEGILPAQMLRSGPDLTSSEFPGVAIGLASVPPKPSFSGLAISSSRTTCAGSLLPLAIPECRRCLSMEGSKDWESTPLKKSSKGYILLDLHSVVFLVVLMMMVLGAGVGRSVQKERHGEVGFFIHRSRRGCG